MVYERWEVKGLSYKLQPAGQAILDTVAEIYPHDVLRKLLGLIASLSSLIPKSLK